MSGAPFIAPAPMTRAQLQELERTAWAQYARQQDDLTDRLSNAHADLAYALGVTRDPGSLVVKCGSEASIQPCETPLGLEEGATRALALIGEAFSLALTSSDLLQEALRSNSALRETNDVGGTR